MRPRGPFAPSVRGFDVLEARSTQGLSLGLAHPGKGASGVSDIHTPGHRLDTTARDSNSGRKLPRASQAAGSTGRRLGCTSQFGPRENTYLVKSSFGSPGR